MRNEMNVELLVNDIKGNLDLIIKNHKIINKITEYMSDKYNINKANIFEVFDNPDNLNKMDITELGLLGEQIAIESGDSNKWLLKYFTGDEIINMRNYKRLDWVIKPEFKKVKKSSFVFNAGFKNSFINTFDRNSIQRAQTLGLFRSIGKIELKFKKDLYEMNQEEIEELLSAVGYKSSNSVIRDIVIINKYIKWAIEHGFTKNKGIELTTARLEVDKYVYRNLNHNYTKEELFYNLQSSNRLMYLVSMCLFNGVGAVDFSEIQNLKIDNLIKTEEGYFVKLDRGLIEIDEIFYNQLFDFNSVKSLPDSKFGFVESDKIFKAYHRSNIKKDLKLNPSIRNRIMNYMKEVMEDDSFTTRTIIRSGINYFAYQLMKKSDTMILNSDITVKLSDRFNMHKNNIGYYHGRMLDELHLDFISTNYGKFEVDTYLKNKLTSKV